MIKILGCESWNLYCHFPFTVDWTVLIVCNYEHRFFFICSISILCQWMDPWRSIFKRTLKYDYHLIQKLNITIEHHCISFYIHYLISLSGSQNKIFVICTAKKIPNKIWQIFVPLIIFLKKRKTVSDSYCVRRCLWLMRRY